jgi:hypothetical protein
MSCLFRRSAPATSLGLLSERESVPTSPRSLGPWNRPDITTGDSWWFFWGWTVQLGDLSGAGRERLGQPLAGF